MKQKVKLALIIRVVALLAGSGLYYLLSNTFINKASKNDDPTNVDEFSSRRLLGVKDHDARDETKSQLELQRTAVKNDSKPEDSSDSVKPASHEIPNDGSTRSERKIVIHVVVSCYCFLMLAVICDEYFIGSIEILCQKLNMKEDVAGATFMAMATSSPELFISCVGTFITEGDIGVGTIVGSAVFNILAVPACCGLFTRTAVQLDWWSVSRDCTFYGFSVIALIAVIYDNQIMWYEAAFLVAAYGVYLIFMSKDDTMSEKAKWLAKKIKRRIRHQMYQEVSEMTPFFDRVIEVKSYGSKMYTELSEPLVKLDDYGSDNCATYPWKVPDDSNLIMFFLRWPITFILWCTIPDSKRFKSFYIITFINCILWIGCISYFVVCISTNVDSVMGLTFLAAGTSLPEAVSSVIVTAQGYGSMGISNSIGSNIFDILLCLGLPWFIKTLIVPTISGQPWITLKSTGIKYSTISLLTTLVALYVSLAVNKFKLDRKIGICCLMFYLLFLIFASLVDFNVLLRVYPTISDY